MSPALVVSLHDVSPLTQPVSTQILAELAVLGIRQTSLLVVPNHHRRAPIRGDAGFQAWLSGLVSKGHEPVLHGYFHQRERGSGESIRSQAVTRIYTAGEGEFYDLSESEAHDRLQNGLADLAFLERKISGFIAPAWLLGPEADKAVRGLGFDYTTRIRAIHLYRGASDLGARSLVWSTRAKWRIWTSLRWNRALAWRVRNADLVRVAIHPPDFAHREVWLQIKQLLARLKRKRVCISYEKLIAGIDGTQ
jgi:predicted deacetylase